MPNELDMDAYHSEGIDPGDHKTFNISPTIHSFNERFIGEPPVSAGPGLDKYNPDEMPDWWVKVLKPNTQWPGEGMQWEPEPMPGNKFDSGTLTKDALFQPISDDRQVPFAPYSAKSIEDIANKHQVEGGKLKEMINDLAQHPENFIGPGELGMVRPMLPTGLPKSFSAYGGRSTTQETAVIADKFAKSSIWSNPQNIEKAISLYQNGKTLKEVGEELGTSDVNTLKLLKEAGVETRGTGPKEGRIFDDDTLNKIDKFRKQGLKWSDIADRLGLNEKSLKVIASRTGLTKPQLHNKQVDVDALSDWMKNQFEGGPSEREFRGMSPEDFNKFNEFQQRRMQTHVANENEKDTADHPLMNIFRKWVEPSINKQQQAYEKAVAKQGKSAENTFKGADRNKYPLTYKIKDEDLLKEFDENAKYLAKARFDWDREGYDPELFKSEFKQRHDIKDELNKRIKNLPQNKNSLDAFLNYLKNKIRDE